MVAWAEFDPDATNFIPTDDLPALLLELPRPLGLRGTSRATTKLATKFCMQLEVTRNRHECNRHECNRHECNRRECNRHECNRHNCNHNAAARTLSNLLSLPIPLALCSYQVQQHAGRVTFAEVLAALIDTNYFKTKKVLRTAIELAPSSYRCFASLLCRRERRG